MRSRLSRKLVFHEFFLFFSDDDDDDGKDQISAGLIYRLKSNRYRYAREHYDHVNNNTELTSAEIISEPYPAKQRPSDRQYQSLGQIESVRLTHAPDSHRSKWNANGPVSVLLFGLADFLRVEAYFLKAPSIVLENLLRYKEK